MTVLLSKPTKAQLAGQQQQAEMTPYELGNAWQRYDNAQKMH